MKKILVLLLFVTLIANNVFASGQDEMAMGESVSVDENAPVTIQFWHAMSGDRIDLIQGIVDNFMEENPNVSVEVQYAGGYNDTLNKVKSAYKAGNAPAIFHSYEIGTLGLINSGLISPVDELANKYDESIDWDNYFVPVEGYYEYQGQHYSMPFNSSTPLMYYNKTLFERAGLDPNDPPETYAEVVEAAKALKASGVDKPVTWNLHGWYFEEMIALQDAPFANNDNGRGAELPTKVLFNDEAGKTLLDWWVGMYNDGLFNDVGPGWSNHRAAFGSGEAAIVLSSSSDVNLLTKALNEKGWELGTGFIPHPEGADGGVAIGGGSLWVTNQLSNEQQLAAVKLVKFIANDESQKAWHKGTGYFPVTKSAMDSLDSEGWFEENPNYKTAFDQLLVSPGTLNTSGALLGVFPETREIVQSAIQECYQGKDTQKALDEAAAEVNELITEWNELIQL